MEYNDVCDMQHEDIQIGMRVSVNGICSGNLFNNQVGKIITIGKMGISIEFDEPIQSGHCGCDNLGKMGHCWNFLFGNSSMNLYTILYIGDDNIIDF